MAVRPNSISWEEAAGIPLAGLTDYQSLYDAGNLQGGQSVLNLGVSGGVGSVGIQLAKVKGARVIGLISKKNYTFMKKLGTDVTVDYHDTNVGEAEKAVAPEGLHLTFDCASCETLEPAGLEALRKAGVHPERGGGPEPGH